jgi:group I intron endonuclease
MANSQSTTIFQVYLVTNTVNGKKYVGQTFRTLEVRWTQHCVDAKKGIPFLFYRAIRKHGAEAFVVTLLDTAPDQKSLDELETQWITRLNTMSPGGYNTKLGKQGHPSPEVCAQISASNKGVKKSAEHARHISEGKKGRPNGLKGKPRDPKASRKTGEANKGRPVPQERRDRISAALKGRACTSARRAKLIGRKRSSESIAKQKLSRPAGYKLTEEHKAKIGAGNLGKKLSEEQVANWKIKMVGYKHSDETRAKISANSSRHGISETTRQKLIESNTGRVRSEETRANLSTSHIGRPWSAKRRAAQNQKQQQKRMEVNGRQM